MPVLAKLKYLRVAPRKVRLVADLIRNKRVDNALNILNFTSQKTGSILLKLLRQAIANAKNNFHLDESNLYISKITVDEGPKLKRFRPRARGSAYEIQKKTSHITIVLDEDKREDKRKAGVATEDVLIKKEEKIFSPKKRKTKTGREEEIIKPKLEKITQKIFRRQTF